MKNLIAVLSMLIMAIPATSLANNYSSNLSNKSAIYTKDAPEPIGPYSQGVKIYNTVYISGQIPIDSKTGELVQGDFEVRFKQAIANLNAIVKAAGGNLDDIAKVTVYVTDLANFPMVNDVMQTYFHQPYPARAVIQVSRLPKNADVEIEAIMQKY